MSNVDGNESKGLKITTKEDMQSKNTEVTNESKDKNEKNDKKDKRTQNKKTTTIKCSDCGAEYKNKNSFNQHLKTNAHKMKAKSSGNKVVPLEVEKEQHNTTVESKKQLVKEPDRPERKASPKNRNLNPYSALEEIEEDEE